MRLRRAYPQQANSRGLRLQVMATLTTSSSRGVPVRATGLCKRFGALDVVRDVSLEIAQGEVVGFVGPNGAGKSTTIRMMLDIFAPDRGAVEVFGAPIDDAARRRIGYLPEERGLYPGLRIPPILKYMAELKGVPPQEAAGRGDAALERMGLAEHRTKKVGELSRGLRQLLQFAATIQHEPEFLILDEPFSGLDPVNVRLMKNVVSELRDSGVAVLFSTHQMTDVEELCDRVVMINQGEIVLNGGVREIRRRHASDRLLVECAAALPDDLDLPGVAAVETHGDGWRISLSDDGSAEGVLRGLLDAGVELERFEREAPTLEEIFLQIVGGSDGISERDGAPSMRARSDG